jgi:CCR4-NOT transcriptional complex subunit CAF120
VAGADGEVVPTFVNLSDASIKMIESLPMNGAQGGNLQNVLSISTAANNRYLLHFNSLNSLTQWTAGIRLAMFEHSTLQEAYTGSLIAGKGRLLNNIKQIMFRTQHAYDDWARVRFGAGTPWRRYWMVISPPDEKEFQKAQKTLKKSSAYERVRLPKGDIKFYDTKKVTKKTRPVATISDAFAAYAIYPQSKPLIEQSTLVKLEGLVTMHSSNESTNEGFVFIMPEVHAAVSGFEIMLRFLFPVFDAFGLYGRPNKLVADTLDQRGLMFAMPRDRRYGYLDVLDVSSLIHTKGSQQWDERRWRREMKKLTADKMMNHMEGGDETNSRQSSQRRHATNRTSMPPPRSAVRFGDDGSQAHSTPGSRSASPSQLSGSDPRLPRTDSAPSPGALHASPHKRSVSEAQGYRRYQTETPSRLSHESRRPDEDELPPPPPKHGGPVGAGAPPRARAPFALERIQSESEVPTMQPGYGGMQNLAASPHLIPPEPVTIPPAMQHQANSRPAVTPEASPELRRAHSNVDAATLYQMQNAVRREGNDPGDDAWNDTVEYRQQNTVASQTYTNRSLGVPADRFQGDVNRKQLDPRQRLSTIPGSPYVGEDAEIFQSPQQTTLPQMDGVPEEPTQPESESAPSERRPPPPVPMHSSKSFARKPVPKTLEEPPSELERTASNTDSATSVINNESWAGGIVDEDALERVLAAPDRQSTMNSATTASSDPDYASTAESSKASKKSMEKPRTGRLKTVGDPDYPAQDASSGGAGTLDTWNRDQTATSVDIPNVDFGPTYALKPSPGSSRPGTSGTMTPREKRRSRSADRLGDVNRLSGVFGHSPRASPNESNRYSYFAGDRTTPSPGRSTPDLGAALGDRSNMAWQPQSQAPARYNRNSMTPEQWVAQRAAMAGQPQYAPPPKKSFTMVEHGRSNSQGMRKLTKTPPLGRTLSGDWPQHAGRQTPDRPQSRGAGMNLESAGASLSAREQMQVSRTTGTPLVNLATNANKQPATQPGLVGHVAARERDRAAAKEGRNSVAVQQAIERQQILAAEAQAQAQQQYQMQMQQAQQAHIQQQQEMERQRILTAQAQAQAQQQYQMQMQQQQQQGMISPQGQYPPQYVAQLQRPGVQVRHSYQQPPPQQQQGYQNPAVQQPYGASYLQQQQQQQQQGRR